MSDFRRRLLEAAKKHRRRALCELMDVGDEDILPMPEPEPVPRRRDQNIWQLERLQATMRIPLEMKNRCRTVCRQWNLSMSEFGGVLICEALIDEAYLEEVLSRYRDEMNREIRRYVPLLPKAA